VALWGGFLPERHGFKSTGHWSGIFRRTISLCLCDQRSELLTGFLFRSYRKCSVEGSPDLARIIAPKTIVFILYKKCNPVRPFASSANVGRFFVAAEGDTIKEMRLLLGSSVSLPLKAFNALY
jgi:hypothetical protein